jgi:thiol-disulfide isomerase/thioredoxin
MADQALRARGSEIGIWTLVVAATASVVGLAIVQGNRGAARPPAQSVAAVTLPLLGGGKAVLPQGKITMVDFWATWCAPCRSSMPRIQQLWREYQPHGVELYSVDTDDPAPDREVQVSEFLRQNGLGFPVALDDGTAAAAFSVANLPTIVLLDRAGHLVWSHVGALTGAREKELRGALDRALKR